MYVTYFLFYFQLLCEYLFCFRVMVGDSNLNNIERFNGEGFAMWKFMMEVSLCLKEIVSIIDGTEKKTSHSY